MVETVKTKKVVEIVDTTITVKFPYSKEIVSSIKELGFLKYNPVFKNWYKDNFSEANLITIEKYALDNGFEVIKADNIIISSNSSIEEEVVKAPSMQYLKKVNRSLHLKMDYNRDSLEAFKELPLGKKWNGIDKVWVINPVIGANVYKRLLGLCSAYKISVEIDIRDIQIFDDSNEVKTVELTDYRSDIMAVLEGSLSSAYKITSHQVDAVNFIKNQKNVLLGDEMGVGKTLSSIASIIVEGDFPALIIMPNHLKYNYRNDIIKFFPKFADDIQVITPKTKKLEGKKFVIINFDTLKKFKDMIISGGFKYIVIDECHNVKNRDTVRFKTLKEIFKKLNPSKRLLMSGTPITNRIAELSPQFELLNVLESNFGNSKYFCCKYSYEVKTPWGIKYEGSRNVSELKQKMESFYLRREKSEVLELPEKIYKIIPLEISNEKEYEFALEDIIAYKRSLGQSGKQLEITNEMLVKLSYLRKILALGKIDECANYCLDLLERGEKVVLFVHHKEVLKALETRLREYNPLTFYGDIDAETRQNNVNEFQNNPEAKLFIASIGAGNSGITLTASCNIVIMELAWTPAIMAQVEDRLHRIGQNRNVNIHYLLAHETIEETFIFPLLEKKRNLFNQVCRNSDLVEDIQYDINKEFLKAL